VCVCVNTLQDCLVLVVMVKCYVLLPRLMFQVFVALTFMADLVAVRQMRSQSALIKRVRQYFGFRRSGNGVSG